MLLQKSKSMQPNDFESDVANSADRGQKKRKRQNNENRFKVLQTPKAGTPIGTPRYLVAETQPRSPVSVVFLNNTSLIIINVGCNGCFLFFS